ncbi:hypothetical protein Mapa_004213 [Marchantia paleacea]|nr:hypothetical protein Mapa_004213 [Marchantia paleacea]
MEVLDEEAFWKVLTELAERCQGKVRFERHKLCRRRHFLRQKFVHIVPLQRLVWERADFSLHHVADLFRAVTTIVIEGSMNANNVQLSTRCKQDVSPLPPD